MGCDYLWIYPYPPKKKNQNKTKKTKQKKKKLFILQKHLDTKDNVVCGTINTAITLVVMGIGRIIFRGGGIICAGLSRHHMVMFMSA